MAGHPCIQETESRKEECFHGLGFGLTKVKQPINKT